MELNKKIDKAREKYAKGFMEILGDDEKDRVLSLETIDMIYKTGFNEGASAIINITDEYYKVIKQ